MAYIVIDAYGDACGDGFIILNTKQQAREYIEANLDTSDIGAFKVFEIKRELRPVRGSIQLLEVS